MAGLVADPMDPAKAAFTGAAVLGALDAFRFCRHFIQMVVLHECLPPFVQVRLAIAVVVVGLLTGFHLRAGLVAHCPQTALTAVVGAAVAGAVDALRFDRRFVQVVVFHVDSPPHASYDWNISDYKNFYNYSVENNVIM
jgi:hypothetical protein